MPIQTMFTVADGTDLDNAITTIDAGGADAAPNTAYTIDVTGPISLDTDLSAINLASGPSVTIPGSGGIGSSTNKVGQAAECMFSTGRRRNDPSGCREPDRLFPRTGLESLCLVTGWRFKRPAFQRSLRGKLPGVPADFTTGDTR